MLQFKKIELADLEVCKEFLKNENELSCENSFVNMLIWQSIYNYMYAIKDGNLFIKSNEGDTEVFRLPIGKDICGGIEEILNYTHGKLPNFWTPDGESFRFIPESFKKLYHINEDRDSFDYLYLQRDLAELKGKKYHSKRNHIKFFEKTYNWTYERLTEKNLSDCIRMTEKWIEENEEKIEDGVDTELDVIKRAFDNFTHLGFSGGVIRIDGEVIAWTLGEKLSEDTYCTHFEKAFSDIRGAYPMINREFAKNELSSYTFVNREEDMGLEGLRKAKLSYKPVKLGIIYNAKRR